MTALIARRNILRNGYFVSPATRAARLYSTPTCLNPTHADMPRAIRRTGRIIIDLIPKVYDKARVVRVIGEDGSQQAKTVNQEAPATDKKVAPAAKTPAKPPATPNAAPAKPVPAGK